MMRKFWLCTLLFVSCVSLAQTTIQRLYRSTSSSGANAFCVQQTMDGGYILAGNDSMSPVKDREISLVKTDANGDTVWCKTYGTPAFEYGQYAIESSTGGFVLVGMTLTASTSWDVVIIRTDANGDTLWTRVFGGNGDDEANFVQETHDGNYIISGYTNSFGAGNYDYFLVKIDPSGNVLFGNAYGTLADELGYTVEETADKGYIMTGAAYMPINSSVDVYSIKTDSLGAVQWSNYYGTADTDWGYMMRQSSDGGYAITGYLGAGVATDAFLIKTDANGDTLWTRTYGGANFEQALAVIETKDKGYALAGSVYSGSLGGSDAMLLKTDSLGMMQYCHGFGNLSDDWSTSLLQLNDGSFVFGGYTNLGSGQYNMYFVKTDTLGNTIANCNEIDIALPASQVTFSVVPIVTSVNAFTVSPTPAVITLDSLMDQQEGCATLGVSSHFGAVTGRFIIYPNPGNGIVNFEADHISRSEAFVRVVNVLGEEICAQWIKNISGTVHGSVDLGKVPAGTYSIQLLNGSSVQTTKLIVIQ